MDTNLFDLIEKFRSDDRCHDYLVSLRWPDGPACPHCQSKKCYRIKARRQFICDDCNRQFSVTAGTIFNDSHLPLSKWFMAVYLMCEAKKSVSANQLKRTLGVSYKTAWYLCHRIRAAMANGNGHKLTGEVEIDETYIGPRNVPGKHGRGAGKKVPVIGMVERGGEVRWSPVKNVSRETILQLVREHISPQAVALYSDRFPAYKKVARHFPVPHKMVNHSREWVVGKVHTNTVESAWSLLKRAIIGAHHTVSKKHLPRYMEEVAWRFNNRKNPRLFQLTLKRLVGGEALKFSDLTKNAS